MAITKSKKSPKLNIKKGDTVLVIAGADKGTEGEVLEVFPHKQRAIVDQVNIVTKHTKATQDNPGGINKVPASVHVSNLMLVDPKSGEPTRVGRKVVDGKLVRFSKKSGEIIR
ncbi:MAG: 50S ribosomal protein L24 [Bacteroidota bacterium]